MNEVAYCPYCQRSTDWSRTAVGPDQFRFRCERCRQVEHTLQFAPLGGVSDFPKPLCQQDNRGPTEKTSPGPLTTDTGALTQTTRNTEGHELL